MSNLLTYNKLHDNEKQQFNCLCYFAKVKEQIGSEEFSKEKEKRKKQRVDDVKVSIIKRKQWNEKS